MTTNKIVTRNSSNIATSISQFFAIAVMLIIGASSNANAQMKFMGIPMNTIKAFEDKVNKKLDLSSRKIRNNYVKYDFKEFEGIKSGYLKIIFNKYDAKGKLITKNDNRLVAHVIVNFESLRRLGIAPENGEPDEHYHEFNKLLKYLTKTYGKPTQTEIQSTETRILPESNVIWIKGQQEVVLITDGSACAVYFTNRKNATKDTRYYLSHN